MKHRILLFSFLLLAFQAFAASGRVRGTVKDIEGKPVEKAVITITSMGEISQTYTAHTNAKGEYIHIGVAPGQYRVSVSKDGYKPVDYAYSEVRVTLSDREQSWISKCNPARPPRPQSKLRHRKNRPPSRRRRPVFQC